MGHKNAWVSKRGHNWISFCTALAIPITIALNITIANIPCFNSS